MLLTELLEGRFRADVRFRGAAYLQSGRVTIQRVEPNEVSAVVRDGIEHQTQLVRCGDQLEMVCTCQTGPQNEATCKHVWATVLAVEKAGHVVGPLKPGYLPAFVGDPNFGKAFDSSSTVTEDDIDWSPHTPKDREKVRLREWETRLKVFQDVLDTSAAVAWPATLDREISYEINLAKSRVLRRLVLQVSQRQRRGNGHWGKWKPLRLRPGELRTLPHVEDRRILCYLSGAAPAPTTATGRHTEPQITTDAFCLPYDLCELILPLMCSTGRLGYRSGKASSLNPLTWDAGSPWRLTIHLTGDDQNDYHLKGWLQRDEDRCELDETQLILPGGLVVTDTCIGLLDDRGTSEWIEFLSAGAAPIIPADEAYDFVERLLSLPCRPNLKLPDHMKLEEVTAKPIPHLFLQTPQRVRWQPQRLRGMVCFEYMGHLVRSASREEAIVQLAQRRFISRDRAEEQQRWTQLESAGFQRLSDVRRSEYDVEITVRDVGRAVRAILDQGWHLQADGKQVRQMGKTNFRIRSKIDWFELHGEVDFQGHRADFPELLSALARGDSTVRLDDGSLGIVPEEWRRQYTLFAELGVAEETHIRFRRDQVGILDVLLASEETVDYDQRFCELRQKVRSFDGITKFHEPSGFQGTLREYQKVGLGWLKFLQKFRFGGCLADDMGLGKTVQLLALLQDRKRKRRRKGPRVPSLIVVPKSLLFNWIQECHRFTPALKALEYGGLARAKLRSDFAEYDLILTTYGTLRRDILDLKAMRFDYVVLDEAQTIKNPRAQIAKAARLLNAEHRLALSGTPVENHLGDLWSIFEFLNPGMLGHSSVLKLGMDESRQGETTELLKQGLRPFILRRTKKQVASDLPDKLEQTIYCDMGDEQARLYDEMRNHYRNSLLGLVEQQGLGKSTMHVLEALLRLRQAACHPALLDNERQDETSAKLDVLCPYLEELIEEGHKALVFSQFTSMLAIVKRHLDQRDIVYEYLDGSTQDRESTVTRFQTDPDCGVFLISLKAGGFGLNLTAADYVFLFDPWWNPAVETQAIDRTHRVGQKRPVFAYRLICRNTVEEKIEELQQHKRSLADAIFQENSSLLKNLTTEDLERLLS